MVSVNGGGHGCPSQALSPESLSLLREGISLILSRWTALQLAIENEAGGRNSRRKSEELASTLLSWFAQSKDLHYIDDLEDILKENMGFSFNTDIEDGSIEEVAEKLMILHEDCLQGNCESIEKLRKSVPGRTAVAQSRRIIDENEDESSDEEVSDMMVDEPKTKECSMEKPKAKELPDEEGWSTVTHKRNRFKRSV